MLSFSCRSTGLKCPHEKADTTKFLLKCKQLIRALFLKSSFGNERGHQARSPKLKTILAEIFLQLPRAVLLQASASLWASTNDEFPAGVWDGFFFLFFIGAAQFQPRQGYQVISCHRFRRCALLAMGVSLLRFRYHPCVCIPATCVFFGVMCTSPFQRHPSQGWRS